jgi:hypothetical protein
MTLAVDAFIQLLGRHGWARDKSFEDACRGNEWKRLARTFDGAIKRNTMTTNPEAVIWNVDAITHVGSPESVR